MKKVSTITLIAISIFMMVACSSSPITPEPTASTWKTGNYIDQFGEPTGQKYVYSTGDGTFTNILSTEGAYLKWEAYIDDSYQDTLYAQFKMLEYGQAPEAALFEDRNYVMSIKLANGTTKDYDMVQRKGSTFIICKDPAFVTDLRNNETIKVAINETREYPASYYFTMTRDNLNERLSATFGK